MKIRIGHLSTFYHTAVLLMAASDINERLGAEVEWKLMGTGPTIMQAFKRGELDLAYIGLPPAIVGIDQGISVICVAGGHVEGTVMAGKSRWKGFPEQENLGLVLSQFRGHKIGVPGKGSIHDVILKDCIAKYGLEQEITVINYPWADLVTEAIVNDDVSAAFGTPALAVAIKEFAGGRVLYPAAKLWPDNPSYGIIVDTGFLKREKELVESFLVLHEEATDMIRKKPEEAAGMIAGFVGVVNQQFVLETLTVSPKYCAKLSPGFVSSTMKFVPVLQRLGYIRTLISPDKIFSPDIIERIHPGHDHYQDGIGLRQES